ncbi:uncharacterized protein LOC143598776 [Bidens hawaiensis]|uniref:uncharacterized protein LOC143598776 n=1 Tax=Bidens hawaiensis TaxID=980011 RepID=UPI00404912F1
MALNSSFRVIICLFTFFSLSLQDACKDKDCGQGKCVADFPFPDIMFHCECDAGWSTIMIGTMPFGSCIIPNCTIDFSCGGKYLPTPPVFPPVNLTSPNCNFVWCGDGYCVADGDDHYCQCRDRAANLLHNPKFICMQQCYLDGDCNHLSLFSSSPPPSSVASPGGGINDASYLFTKLPAVLVAIFTGIFLSRI